MVQPLECLMKPSQIVGVSKLTRDFASKLKRVIDGEEIFIARNNEIQAVIISLEEYQRLCTVAEIAESQDLAKIIKKRKGTDRRKNVELEEFLRKHGL